MSKEEDVFQDPITESFVNTQRGTTGKTRRQLESNSNDSVVTMNTPNDSCRANIRIPPFWPEEPDIWFAQVEGQFTLAGITSQQTKFNFVISQLDNRYSREVKDIIINPPTSEMYDKLKSELIKRLTASNEKKLKQLLMHEELGDRKPSQFLRHLADLAGTGVPDDFLKTIWISRLPSNIQTFLAGQSSKSTLDDLADLADRVNDITSSSSSAPTVASTSSDIPGSTLSALTKEIAELRRQVQQLSMRNNNTRSSRSHSRRSPRGRSGSRTRSQSNYRKYPLCWYHSKFGEKASSCITPCDFKAGNAKGSR